jgi:hypothetical protein
MNEALAVVGIGCFCFAALVWWVPEIALQLSEALQARAGALAAARRVYRAKFEELRPSKMQTAAKGAKG